MSICRVKSFSNFLTKFKRPRIPIFNKISENFERTTVDCNDAPYFVDNSELTD